MPGPGSGTVPSRWSTGLTDGGRRGLRYLMRLSERLLGLELPPPHNPDRRLGPAEVEPGLWVSNLLAAPRFARENPDGAVISLCSTEGRLDGHGTRREIYLADSMDKDENPALDDVLDEILTEIRCFHDEGRPVLVHCRFGASRTGFALRGWLMETSGLDEEQATVEAQCRWPKVSTWNTRFTAALRRRQARGDGPVAGTERS